MSRNPDENANSQLPHESESEQQPGSSQQPEPRDDEDLFASFLSGDEQEPGGEPQEEVAAESPAPQPEAGDRAEVTAEFQPPEQEAEPGEATKEFESGEQEAAEFVTEPAAEGQDSESLAEEPPSGMFSIEEFDTAAAAPEAEPPEPEAAEAEVPAAEPESAEPEPGPGSELLQELTTQPPTRRGRSLAALWTLLLGLILGGGAGAGSLFYFLVQPKEQQIDQLQSAQADLQAKLKAAQADKAEAEQTAAANAKQLDQTRQQLDETSKKLADTERILALAREQKAKLAEDRDKVEKQRDLIQQQAQGCLALALSPQLVLAADKLPTAADLKQTPELAKLWQNHFAIAEAAFTKAIDHDPDQARLYAMRALARQAQGADPAEIDADLQKALALDAKGQDPVVQFVVARLYQSLGRSSEAAERLELAAKAVAASPTDGLAVPVAIAERRGEYLRRAALASARPEAGQAALALVEQALQTEGPETPAAERAELRLRRARLLLARGRQRRAAGAADQAAADWEAAASAAAEAVEIARDKNIPLLPDALTTQALCLELLQRWEQALKSYEAATALARTDAEKARLAAARARVRAARILLHNNSTAAGRPPAARPDRSSVSHLALLRLLTLLVQQQRPADQPQPAKPPKAGQQAAPTTPPQAKPSAQPAAAELSRALREAELALEKSGGKSPDAYFAKGLALAALQRHNVALEAFAAGAPLLLEHPGDVTPDRYVQAFAMTYRLRAATPDELKLKQLEQQVSTLTARLDQTGRQLDQSRQELGQTGQQLQSTAKQLADTQKALAQTKDTLARTRVTLQAERAELEKERYQHQLWKGRYEALMVGSSTEDQRASRKLFDQGVAQYFRGDYAAAVQTLSDAIRLHPRDARYRYFRGLAYYHLNNAAAAETDLKEAAALERQDAPRRYEINLVLQRIQGAERVWLESFRPKNEQ